MIVNPDNLDPLDEKVKARVPIMWYAISALYTVIWAISVSLQPAPWDQEAENEK